MIKTAIISPSGNYYGSEQTLNSFLNNTRVTYNVYVKYVEGGFYSILNKGKPHKLFKFSNIPLLYIRLAFVLLFKYNTIYINEGGHIRYIKILAKIFRK